MKKLITLLLVLMMTLTMAACADKTEPTGDPADESGQSTPSETTEPTTPESTDAIARQDGDRYEAVIVIEGMEETVNYQYVRNESAGFEMAFDYDSFVRRSESDRECFFSSYDDPKDPQNYLEVAYSAEDAEDVAAAIRNNLSQTYDLLDESRELYQAGSCIYIEASELKGTGTMPDKLQMVYIIPANDGCRVATAHCIIEGAEGFGVRFSAMLNTLTVLDTQGDRSLSSEQAAQRKYGR